MSDESDRVQELLERVTEALGLQASVSVSADEDGIRGVLEGEELGLFIGRHGQTIDAVQHLAFKVANRNAGAQRPPGRTRRDERDRAQGRARVSEGP